MHISSYESLTNYLLFCYECFATVLQMFYYDATIVMLKHYKYLLRCYEHLLWRYDSFTKALRVLATVLRVFATALRVLLWGYEYLLRSYEYLPQCYEYLLVIKFLRIILQVCVNEFYFL